MGKCGKLSLVVRLQQMLRRWLLAADVPAGHVAVCVGISSRRFVVRATSLNHPIFRQLLRQAEEEYGSPSSGRPGPLSLPCDEVLFEHLLHLISTTSSSSFRFANCDINELAKLCSSTTPTSDSYRCCGIGRWLPSADVLPLLHPHCFSHAFR
ncbi:auxin-responsive protein SAUR50-like [Zingiber officinale]|uniref:Uncharacterized protein n=1 Tax=Zingiber officinale TaxID=94328 RepID=A0A8J5I1P4_ZINOF|nr:auxin-responsive protein SAUR50-like [Zingiber officinale]KAG6526518.1 hypothetical protein ZIOFF_016508 [Zingiber officinale]